MLEKLQNWALALGSKALNKLVPALILLMLGILVCRLVIAIVNKLLDKSTLEKAAHSLIKSLVRVVLYLLLGLMIASALGIDVTGVIALASVLTLAVSLAVQNALTNVIGGFTLLYTHPFASGDFVEIAGQSGTVREIGLTYTKLATPDNKIISIPNSAVVAAEIVNYTVTGLRRVAVDVSAAYDTDSQAVIDSLLRAADLEKILPDPAPSAVLVSYGESTVNYSLRVWTTAESYWDVQFALNVRVREQFAKDGVKMSYPHLNVHLDK